MKSKGVQAMKFSGDNLLLYAVTDSRWCTDESLEEKVKKALDGGATLVQLREKNLPDDEFLKLAERIKKVTDSYDVPLLINDNVDVALKSGAAGVHVGQNDMKPDRIREILGSDAVIGVTAKTVEQAREAEEKGADYLGTGAFFVTGTKTDALPIDRKKASEIVKCVNIPVVGIGGITLDNAEELEGLGLDGIAVVSALFKSDTIKEDAERLKKIAMKVRGDKND